MNNTMFSIIVPAYNVEEYIEDAIKSVLRQNYENYEIIVVDDASTDNTLSILNSIKSDKLKIYSIQHKGVSYARNFAIKKAKGDFIIFLDSDDMLESWTLFNVNKIIKKDKDITTFIGMYNTIKEDNSLFGCKSETLKPQKINNKTKSKVLEYLYLNRIVYTVWRFIVRKDIIIDNELFFLEGLIHEDEEWVPKMLANSKKFYLIDKPFYNYRIRQNSIMNSDNHLYRQKCLVKIAGYLLEYSEKEPDEDLKKLYSRSAYKNLFQAYLLVRKNSSPIEPEKELETKTLKNIIIFGTSRSGKTTLANLISKKTGYNLICIDNIVSGFQKGFPDLNINHSNRDGTSTNQLSRFLEPYIKSLNGINQKLRNIYYIIEGSYFNFETLTKYKDDFVVIILTTNYKNVESCYENIKKHDKNYDWTKKLTDTELFEYSKNLMSNNKYIVEECEKHGIKYYDMSVNRKKKLNLILQEIEFLVRR